MTEDKNKKGAIAEALDALEGLLAECKDDYRKDGDLAIFDRNYAEEIQAHANLQAFVDKLDHPDDIDKSILYLACLLYTSPSPRDRTRSRMPSSA